MLPYELTKDTPYLALSGELWSVFYEYFNRNWPCYKGFLLYHYNYPPATMDADVPSKIEYLKNPSKIWLMSCEQE